MESSRWNPIPIMLAISASVGLGVAEGAACGTFNDADDEGRAAAISPTELPLLADSASGSPKASRDAPLCETKTSASFKAVAPAPSWTSSLPAISRKVAL